MLVDFDHEDDSMRDLAERIRLMILDRTTDDNSGVNAMPWSAGLEFEEVSFRCGKDFETGTIAIEIHNQTEEVEVELTANAGLTGPTGGRLTIEIPISLYEASSSTPVVDIVVTGEDSVEAVAKSSDLVACLVGLEEIGIPLVEALLQIVHGGGEIDGVTPHAARTLALAVRLKQI